MKKTYCALFAISFLAIAGSLQADAAANKSQILIRRIVLEQASSPALDERKQRLGVVFNDISIPGNYKRLQKVLEPFLGKNTSFYLLLNLSCSAKRKER